MTRRGIVQQDLIFITILGILALFALSTFICVQVESSAFGGAASGSCAESVFGVGAEEDFSPQSKAETELNAYLKSEVNSVPVSSLWFTYMASRDEPSKNQAVNAFEETFEDRDVRLVVENEAFVVGECPSPPPTEAPRAFRDIPLPGGGVGTVRLVLCE